MAAPPDDHPDRSVPEPRTPLGLNYLAPSDEHPVDPLTRVAVVAVLLGWVPFLCGLLNALVVARSYSPAITGPHVRGAVLFLGGGIALTGAALVVLVRLRRFGWVVFGSLSLLVQLAVVGCIALVRQ